MVKPGGRLAITTWGPNLFEPTNGAFWDAIHIERPDLHRGFNPWDHISEPDGYMPPVIMFKSSDFPTWQYTCDIKD